MARTYRVRVISFEDREFEDADLISQTAAAELLGCSVQGVQSIVERGRLTMVIDPQAHSQQRHHLVIRAEVLAYKRKRRRRAPS